MDTDAHCSNDNAPKPKQALSLSSIQDWCHLYRISVQLFFGAELEAAEALKRLHCGITHIFLSVNKKRFSEVPTYKITSIKN